VRVDLPRRVQLFSLSGGHVTLEDVTADVPAVTRLDAAGNLSFHFAGRLILPADLAGPFRGDLPITVEYQ
jgi:type 1 fimbria pilin